MFQRCKCNWPQSFFFSHQLYKRNTNDQLSNVLHATELLNKMHGHAIIFLSLVNPLKYLCSCSSIQSSTQTSPCPYFFTLCQLPVMSSVTACQLTTLPFRPMTSSVKQQRTPIFQLEYMCIPEHRPSFPSNFSAKCIH